MQRSTAGKMLNIAHFQHIRQAAGFILGPPELFPQL
jgi:hypothetical protein